MIQLPTPVRFHDIEKSDRLFLVGTTLATFSAFRYTDLQVLIFVALTPPLARLAQHAIKLGKPVLLLNVGPTRVDGLRGVEKIEISTSHVMRGVVRAVL